MALPGLARAKGAAGRAAATQFLPTPKCNELPGWQAQRSRGDFRFGNTRRAVPPADNKKGGQWKLSAF